MIRSTMMYVCVVCLANLSCAPFLPGEKPAQRFEVEIDASVTEVDDATGLPLTLSGSISGDLTGTYSEVIVEVFFDNDGNLLGALSISQFTFDDVPSGRLFDMGVPANIGSTNFVTVASPVLQMDDNGELVLDESGDPIVIGMVTAATGDLFGGTDALETAFGDIETLSTFLFGVGDAGLGQVTATLQMRVTLAR